MKKYTLVIFVMLLLFSCKPGKDAGGNIITVSIQPISYFAKAIAGDHFSVNVIVPPGASHATYEPTPSSVRDLRRSKGIIFNGYLTYELAWREKLLQVNRDISVLDLSEGMELIEGAEHDHGDGEHETGVDPHFWMSPSRAFIIAARVKNFIVTLDPPNKDTYEKNYRMLVSEIEKQKALCDSLLKPLAGSSFMIFHPALTYLASDYDLRQIPVEAEGKEPSPADLRSFIDTGRREGIKVIFIQREFDKRNALTIAGEIGARLVEIDPMSSDWPGSVSYIARSLAESIEISEKNDSNE